MLSALALAASLSCPPQFEAVFRQGKSDHSQTHSIEYNSHALGGKARVNITLPPGFPRSDEKVDLVFFLHGRNGQKSPKGMFTELDGERVIDRALQSGKCKRRFLMIAPFDVKASYWREGPRDQPVLGTESLVVKELLGLVRACAGRSLDLAKKPAIGGISAGGNAALYYGLKYPDTFGQVYALSPVFRPDKDGALEPEDRRAFGRHQDFKNQDPVYLYSRRSKKNGACRYPLSRFRTEIAQDDVFLPGNGGGFPAEVTDNTLRFLKRLEQGYPGSALTPTLKGGHSEKFWRGGIERMVDYFCEGFSIPK